jgi:hypothetical protein
MPFYSYEHMFQSSSKRLRAWLSRFDDILGDPPADTRSNLDSAREGAPYGRAEPHPHRQPLRWERERRPGSVAAAPAICISPFHAGRESGRRERASRHPAGR